MLDLFERLLNMCKFALYISVAIYTYFQLLAIEVGTPKAEIVAELLTGKLGQFALAIAVLEAISCLFNALKPKSV
ncbi:hypothetical protein ABD86_25565 [Paenibacillus alvei]|nr:hypothetical protein [Paenibacillus alvei]MBG9736481.1 hypothetical protein [Paenibacillus alvei]MBG9736519.1 hypothetical protein [Paenibacillus alvei]MBG9736592.1 hypothetical protein [Paenibacillus alvei]MBG9745576.1 hypothetical protein [Paenibacillus alvei]